MNYQFIIKGMHCKGCETLTQMVLEENNFKNTQINQSTNVVQTQHEEELEKMELDLKKAFQELKNYSYSNLIKIEN